MIRDEALVVSGLLAGRLGGPSVKPYQPEGVWEAVAMPESNTHFYRPDHGDRLYRRSLYTFWKRSAPPASMEILNAPDPRDLHRPPRADRHAAPGAGHPQRPAVRRGRPRPGRSPPSRTAPGPDLRRSPRLCWPAACWPARSGPEELSVVQASLSKLEAFYRSHPDDAPG